MAILKVSRNELEEILINGDEPRTQREWNLLFAYRLAQVEQKINSLYRSVTIIGGGILIGVVVYLLTVVVAGSSQQ